MALRTGARLAPLSSTIFWNSLRLMSDLWSLSCFSDRSAPPLPSSLRGHCPPTPTPAQPHPPFSLQPVHSQMPTGRMIAFTMALMGCLLIMYKAIWYDQFSCPDGFLLRVRPALWAPGLERTVEPRREHASEGPGESRGRSGCSTAALSTHPLQTGEQWVFLALWEHYLPGRVKFYL